MKIPTSLQALPHAFTRFKRSLKCSFHCWTMSPVQVSSSSPSTVHSLGKALPPLPEVSNGFSELPRGQPKVFPHSPPELLPHLSFSFRTCHSCSLSGQQLPDCRFKRSLSKPGPKSFLLQPDGFLYGAATQKPTGSHRHQLPSCQLPTAASAMETLNMAPPILCPQPPPRMQ